MFSIGEELDQSVLQFILYKYTLDITDSNTSIERTDSTLKVTAYDWLAEDTKPRFDHSCESVCIQHVNEMVCLKFTKLPEITDSLHGYWDKNIIFFL